MTTSNAASTTPSTASTTTVASTSRPTSSPATTAATTDHLSPALVMRVLSKLAQFEPETSVIDIEDYETSAHGFGILAGIEAVEAIERAGTARPVVTLVYDALAQWGTAGERGAERNSASQCLADLASSLVALTRPLEGPARAAVIAAGGNAAGHMARWLLDVAGEQQAHEFIEALRAIPAAR